MDVNSNLFRKNNSNKNQQKIQKSTEKKCDCMIIFDIKFIWLVLQFDDWSMEI